MKRLGPETPEAKAKARTVITAVREQEWKQWCNLPLTSGFLQYLEDQIDSYRDVAADLLENGQLRAADPHQDKNPDCLRGQIVMLRQILGIELDTIHNFYGKDDNAQSSDSE